MTDVKVTVGIPTLNGPDRLRRCLRSIAECTDWSAFGPGNVKVLICDDGSTPENLEANKHVLHEAERLRQVSGAEMIMSPTRDGIAKSWNKLVRHQACDVAALLNDDIEVVEHWLDVLVYSVMENPQAGMIGLNSYVGVIKGQVPPPLRVDYCESHLLSGGGRLVSSQGPIFAFRRDVYDLVGGFDERYFVFYEECDFGVALRQKGYVHYMADYPRVYHMGGATNSEPKNLDAASQIAASREKFRQKWGRSFEQIRQEYGPAPTAREWNTQINNWK
jgi:GT2 family glycosyltransferase